MKRSLWMLGGCALALAGGTQALAQQAGGAPQLEEVVVTAQHRSENLQDTSASISALTARDIEGSGVKRIEDISTSLPNVYISPRELRTTSISIRGISADLNNPGLDQGVGVYVDGVYMGRAATINSNLFDLERIEVLRGPQGTLYGRNTIAGAVNFISAKPGPTPHVQAQASYGDYNAVSANALVSGPITDKIFASAAVSTDRRDGFVKNLATGTELDDINSLAGKLAVVLAPGGDWDITLRADAGRDRTHSGAFDILDNGVFTGAPFADADPWDRQVAQDYDTTQDRDLFGFSGELNWHAAGGVVTAVTGYRGYTRNNVQDNDYTVLDLLGSGVHERQRQFSQEVRFASDAANRFNYVVGAYYFHQSLDTVSTATIGPDLGIYPTRTPVFINGDVDTTSGAVFGRAVYRLTDQLSLVGGLRYTSEKKDLLFSQVGDPFQVLAPNIAPRNLSISEDNVSPLATIEWRPREGVLGYVTFSKGFKAGGFNVFSVSATADAKYKSESVDNYEAGFKADFLDRRLRLNGSVFYMDYTNLQANQLILVGGLPQFQTSNAAKAHSAGLELELAARPTQELQFTAAYGYLDASYSSYPNATAAGADYTDNTLPLAPHHNASLAAEWTHPVGDSLEFVLRGEASYRSRIFFAADNAYESGGLTLFNARASIQAADGRWRATLWGRNLSDETYAINRFAGPIVPGQVVQSLGAPRTFGVELGLSY